MRYHALASEKRSTETAPPRRPDRAAASRARSGPSAKSNVDVSTPYARAAAAAHAVSRQIPNAAAAAAPLAAARSAVTMGGSAARTVTVA